MDKILISACLLGEKTRYDGGSSNYPFAEKLKEKYTLVPFCPEVEGGLSVPREPCERLGADVVDKNGKSHSKEYMAGAEKALQACRLFGIGIAILKESSPSCGVRNIYDGHFRGIKVQGMGVTAEYLEANGIKVYSSLDNLDFLLNDNSYKKSEFKPFEQRRRKKVYHGKPSKKIGSAEVKEEKTENTGYHKPYSHEKRTFVGKKKSYSKKEYGDKSFEKKPYAEKKPYGEKKRFSKDGDKSFEKKSYGKKPYGKSKFSNGGSYKKNDSYKKWSQNRRKPE